MSIVNHVNSSASTSLGSLQTVIGKRKSDFQTLSAALGSGDLLGAQKAFATLQADRSQFQNLLQSIDPTRATPSAQQTQRNHLYASLAQALANGDLTGARQAFQALEPSTGSRGMANAAPGVSAVLGNHVSVAV